MLLYIHVPFCRSKCAYCAFFSEPLLEHSSGDLLAHCTHQAYDKDNATEKVDDWDSWDTWDSASQKSEEQKNKAKAQLKEQSWLDTLLLEIELRAKEIKKNPNQEKKTIKSIFFGGGTPSLLAPSAIDIIIRKIKRHFKVDKKIEITLEANPESLDSKEKIEKYLESGISRISIGVQALDDALLQKLGRVHTVEQASQAITLARSAGCKNINVDIIWGLPSQRLGHWVKQLKLLMQWQVDHISAYSLTIEDDTPFAHLLEKDADSFPDEETLSKMYTRTAEIFQENGYLQYEISNYSRMGFHCRHNIGYWEGEDYLGFGPSATSTVGEKRWTNAKNIDAWIEEINSLSEGKPAPKELENLTLQDRVIELIMLRLRTTRGLRVKAFTELTGRDFVKDNKKLIDALHKNGLLRLLNGYLRLTHSGFMVSNAILRHLVENTKKQLKENKD